MILLKEYLSSFFTNYKGDLRINEKLIVIESDDWGAIRTPSRNSLLAFSKAGFELEKSLYKVDALASESDLDDLFNLLVSFKNVHGESPILTANAIMANPDFQRIRESDYKTFYYERFTETFKHYPEHQNNLRIWKKGIEEKIFYPQFHGREHLNIAQWMKALQSGDKKVHLSFDLGSTYSGIGDYSFMAAYEWSDRNEIDEHKKIIEEGLNIFEETFGYKSKTFIAPCYTWDNQLEGFLAKKGIQCIQGIRSQLSPTGTLNQFTSIPHYFGQQNKYGSYYNIRNVFFEPVNNPNIDWTRSSMARIQTAFLMKRPAVISTHRVNYVGYIDQKNKENGLSQLGSLLTQILKKWPDVRFITTDQLVQYMIGYGKN
jgi:hypothetical protein